jgi:hypothetical protein
MRCPNTCRLLIKPAADQAGNANDFLAWVRQRRENRHVKRKSQDDGDVSISINISARGRVSMRRLLWLIALGAGGSGSALLRHLMP